MRISNLFKPSIQRHILLSFGLVILINLIFTIFSFSRLDQVRIYAEEVVPVSERITLIQDFLLDLSDIDSNIETYLVTTSPQIQAEIKGHLADARLSLDQLATSLQNLPKSEHDALADAFETFETQIQSLFGQDFLRLSAAGRNRKIVDIYAGYDRVMAAQQTFTDVMLTNLNQMSTDQRRIISSFVLIYIILNVISLGVAIVTSQLASRSIANPISQSAAAATLMADGQLQVRVANAERNDEIGLLARAFNSMAEQLNQLIEGLEHRVAERTRDLKVAADVSSQISRVLDIQQLLPYISNTTREGFSLAHVSIFLYEEQSNMLRLVAGSGSVGRTMLQQGKQFSLDQQGLVPLAARTLEYQIINDVNTSKDHFVNPLLPDTCSEAALPMRVGTRLVGVLDLQSTATNYFGNEQIAVLTTLADQIAIAVQNAESFTNLQVARAEAEQASVVKSQFLASMSHELRTPLNAVLNFTQFVSSGMLGTVNSEQIEMLDKVVYSGKHLLGLINDVLDISKIEAGALKLFVETNVDLQQEVETVLATAQTMLADKPVQLTKDIDDQLPLIVGDKRRIRQIMLNLVSNACKFTDEGQVHIVINRTGDHIHFAVTDTGSGIAQEDQHLVFETFHQTENGLRQGEGTGLGLPISRRLVETHGGELGFESRPNVGSTFYFTLPIHNPALTPLVKTKEQIDVA